jgi:DNA-binding MarR family transcriptional regulator
MARGAENIAVEGRRTETAFRALILAFGLLKRVMEPFFARFGISGSQWGVLRVLHRAQEEGQGVIRLTDLSTRLLIRPPSVTGTIDRLERMGLVARRVSATDQRAREVGLTSAGRRLMRRVLKEHPAQVQSVLAGLVPSERNELHRLLEQMAAHMERMLDGAERASG